MVNITVGDLKQSGWWHMIQGMGAAFAAMLLILLTGLFFFVKPAVENALAEAEEIVAQAHRQAAEIEAIKAFDILMGDATDPDANALRELQARISERLVYGEESHQNPLTHYTASLLIFQGTEYQNEARAVAQRVYNVLQTWTPKGSEHDEARAIAMATLVLHMLEEH